MSRNLRRIALTAMLCLAGISIRHSIVFAQDQRESRQIMRRVPPDYPEIAKRMNVTGKVRVEVVIGQDGRVKRTRPLGGHPLLVQSVEKALKDWKFSPAAEQTTQVVQVEFAGTEVH
jgi:TonB family protein